MYTDNGHMSHFDRRGVPSGAPVPLPVIAVSRSDEAIYLNKPPKC